MVDVVCGVIWCDNKILIGRRNQNKSMAGKWEFPGGKVEGGETEKEALARELMEELGMQVDIKDYIGSFPHQYKTIKINLIAYHCNFISSAFNMTDHDKYEWGSIEGIKTFELPEADVSIVDYLLK